MPFQSSQSKAIIVFLLVAYTLIGVTIYYTQNHIIFRSGGPFFDPPGHLHIDEVFIDTPDGEKLFAWWLQTENAKRTVLFFQGNGRNLTYQRYRLTTFGKLGLNALLIDYRGYGKSSGEIEEEQDIYLDGMAAWDFLTNQREILPKNIILWGRSLGGGVAAEIAQKKDVSALVLESTFSSLDDMARLKYWFLPTRLFLKFHFDNAQKLRQVMAPVIIIHSVEDGYIPFSQAATLFDAANEPKTLMKTTGSHLDLFDQDQKQVLQLSAYLGLGGRNTE
jgi:fermentation-respiration switch protein FrsA (DUF1100 family)